MTIALYIVLGLLAVGVVAMQVWIARSATQVAGDRAGLVRAVRGFNIVLLVVAFGLVAYALSRG